MEAEAPAASEVNGRQLASGLKIEYMYQSEDGIAASGRAEESLPPSSERLRRPQAAKAA
eukprot:SAG22_NODE_5704_length_968_cov_2.760644_2_plen_58_part_01